MAPPRISSALLTQLRSLALSSSTRPVLSARAITNSPSTSRLFSTTRPSHNWLIPPQRPTRKQHKGRAPVPTGGSIKGTTLTHGTWGIRLISPGQRIPSKNFRIAEETIKRRLKGQKYSIYPRVVCNVAVYTSGNDQRMGKGKGSFDYWAARVRHGGVVLEIAGAVHEHLVKDALRLAGNKLPGQWEFITKDDPPIMGNTKWQPGVSKEDLFKPKRDTPLHPLHVLPDGSKVVDQGSIPATGSSL